MMKCKISVCIVAAGRYRLHSDTAEHEKSDAFFLSSDC